jgi:hypothetical protein
MIKIQTTIDELVKFIESHSPVKESRIPKSLKVHSFDKHINLLETRGMIEIKVPFFSKERTFIFKSNKASDDSDPWVIKKFY